jgi:hypothetical protein
MSNMTRFDTCGKRCFVDHQAKAKEYGSIITRRKATVILDCA